MRKLSRDQLLAAFVENADDAINAVDVDGNIVLWNRAAEVLHGYTREEMLGQPVSRLWTPEASFDARAVLDRLRRGERIPPAEGFRVRKDGSRFYGSAAISPLLDDDGTFVGAAAVIRDITPLKRIELALAESEAQHRRIIETTSDGVWTIDKDAKTTFVNEPIARMLGVPRDQMNGRSIFDFFDDEGRASTAASLERRRHGISETREERLRRPDGTNVWVHIRASPLFGPNGEYEGAVAMMTDVTQRRSAERMRALLASIIEMSDDAILSIRLDGTVLSWNRAAERLYGYRADEIIGKSVSVLLPPDRAAELGPLVGRPAAGERIDHFETMRLRKDGTLVAVSISVAPIRDASGKVTGVSSIVRDLTAARRAEEDLRHTEEQLRHSQKMEAVGRLAGGVAHDFNNLLTVMLGCTESILKRVDPDESPITEIVEIHNAAKRAAGLTRQLLAFSRKQVLSPKIVDLGNVVAGAEQMLARMVGDDVELAVLSKSATGRVFADPSQLEQVIMNLAVNAKDAMPNGGRLTVETADVVLSEEYAADHIDVTPGPYVMLAVTDTGTGMDEATRSRLFEPFFTTKKEKGTGLGLATVYGIVKQSGGHIWLDSEPGQGTSVKVYFPHVTKGVPETPVVRTAEQVTFGSETVLLVEDDALVRGLLKRVLRGAGYTVLEAGDPGDALLASEQFNAKIHLLLTDVVMQRMPGPQLAERLVAARPGLRVLYMSGYTDNAIVHHGVIEANLAFIQKPMTPDALLAKVREVLDGS